MNGEESEADDTKKEENKLSVLKNECWNKEKRSDGEQELATDEITKY